MMKQSNQKCTHDSHHQLLYESTSARGRIPSFVLLDSPVAFCASSALHSMRCVGLLIGLHVARLFHARGTVHPCVVDLKA